MAAIALYGIPNCDGVRKARKWLDTQGIAYTFHDYKKEGVDPARLSSWADAAGWTALLNKRGTTYRALPEADKADLDRDKALALLEKHPSAIKRPVIETPDSVLVGFDEDAWSAALR